METDFNIVKHQILKVYHRDSSTWINAGWRYIDLVRVFERFYGMYFMRMRRCHPALRTDTIRRVMELLIDDGCIRYKPGFYLEGDIFEKYFESKFEAGCDYSIVHFSSGVIRMRRCVEDV